VVKQSRRGPVVSTNEPRRRPTPVSASGKETPATTIVVNVNRQEIMDGRAHDGRCNTGCRCDYCVGFDTEERGKKRRDNLKLALM
jgi:hypothetical protein